MCACYLPSSDRVSILHGARVKRRTTLRLHSPCISHSLGFAPSLSIVSLTFRLANQSTQICDAQAHVSTMLGLLTILFSCMDLVIRGVAGLGRMPLLLITRSLDLPASRPPIFSSPISSICFVACVSRARLEHMVSLGADTEVNATSVSPTRRRVGFWVPMIRFVSVNPVVVVAVYP